MADTTDALIVALRGHGDKVKLAVRFTCEDMFWCVSFDHRYSGFYGVGSGKLGDVDNEVLERWEIFGLADGARKKGVFGSTFQVNLSGSDS